MSTNPQKICKKMLLIHLVNTWSRPVIPDSMNMKGGQQAFQIIKSLARHSRKLPELEVELFGEVAEFVAFAGFDEDEGDAFFARAGGASAAVGEVFDLLG